MWFSGVIFGKTRGERTTPLEKFSTRFLDEFTGDIINIEELASLYHLPNKSVETPNIAWTQSKRLEYPLNIPTSNARIVGVTDYRGVHIPFGIKPIDRLRHMYLLGKTGMGKSTFVENLIMADIYEGQGIAFIDPHGDSINVILDSIPPHRLNDVVIFDPGDNDFPVGLNLLELKPGENKSLVADGLVSVFKKAFSDSWGPRLEYILTNTILTLLSCQNVSLLAVPRILSDKNYRKFLLKQVDDPVLLKFWEEEYSQLSRTKKDTMDNIGSILNKIGRFTTNPLIRNIVGQIKSTMDFEEIMNNRKILLINLAQGKIGEENMGLLGGMLITRLYSTTVRRVDIDRAERVPFYLYVDEFQNFATSTFVKILSEARKFGLGLTFTHQFIDQIDEDIQNAIFGNVGSLLNFAVGPRDAARLVKEYSPYLSEEDIVNQSKYSFIIKLSIDFAQSKPFTAKSLPPSHAHTGLRTDSINLSRQKYAKSKEEMEQKIYKWAGQVYNDKGNLFIPKNQRTESGERRKENREQRTERVENRDLRTDEGGGTERQGKKGNAESGSRISPNGRSHTVKTTSYQLPTNLNQAEPLKKTENRKQKVVEKIGDRKADKQGGQGNPQDSGKASKKRKNNRRSKNKNRNGERRVAGTSNPGEVNNTKPPIVSPAEQPFVDPLPPASS